MAELYANNQTGIANSPQVTVIRPSGNLNLQCDNIVNPPDGEFIFTTYRTMTDPGSGEQVVDPSSIREMTGTSSTNIITITSFAPGNTDDGNQVGDHVVFRPGAHWANTVAKRLDPAGTFVTTQTKLAATVKDLTANRDWVLPNTGIITKNTGLIGSLSNIKYYIAGKSYEKTSIPDKTYVATRDTYVFINTAGAVTYSDVAVGGTAPTPPANSVLIGVVTTGASAITAISIKNNGSIASSNIDTSAGTAESANPGTAGGTRRSLILGNVLIQWGRTASFTQAAQTEATRGVTFATPYASTPTFLAYIDTAAGSIVNNLIIGSAVSTTAAHITFRNNTSSAGVGGAVSWVAIGLV